MSTGFDVEVFQETLESLDGGNVRNLVVHGEVDSTSSDLRRRIDNGAPPGTVVVAGRQTAGRGRSGREWFSAETGNLYLSICLSVSGDTQQSVPMVPMVPLAAGIAAHEAISRECRVDCRLKWPNDVLVSGKKLAGILTELVALRGTDALVIVGIGINTGIEAFPEAIRDIATSIPILKGTPANPAPIAARFVHGVASWLSRIAAGERTRLVDAWKACAEPFGRRVRVGSVEGVTRDLAPDGRLLLTGDNGEVVSVVGGIVEPID